MKYITFAVPCYNSEDYMRRCIDSLLPGGDRVEIIIVNDGSTDRTGLVADVYQAQYPDIVKVVHQENKGHGGAVNAGLGLATGKYFKVVDSDDWLDSEAMLHVLEQIGKWEQEDEIVDMVVCNYIYDHLYENRQRLMHYRNVFPRNVSCGWEEIRSFSSSQYLIMHAIIFHTDTVRKSGVKLPQHTFYVDNIFAYQPLPFVERIRYLDVDLYHYFLGREDQSVNEEVMMKRIDQQIRVTKLVSECTDLETVEHPKLTKYMVRNISIMFAISSIHLLLIGSPEALDKRAELWNYMKNNNSRLYRKLRYQTLSGLTYLPGKAGELLTITGYQAAKKIYKFQ